jgi:CBS domain-containing protein
VTALVGQVKDWMSRRPAMVPLQRTVGQVTALMRAQAIRHVLVMDGDRLAGIVSNRDVRALVLEGEPNLLPDSPITRAMTDGPVTVGPDALLTEAARAMLERKIGALPVVEEGRVLGILTRSDVLEALLAWAERGRPA